MITHADFCDRKSLSPDDHNCMSGGSGFIAAVLGIEVSLGRPSTPPVATAVAYRLEPGSPRSVLLTVIDGERSTDLMFAAAHARQLADQILAAADLVDGNAR